MQFLEKNKIYCKDGILDLKKLIYNQNPISLYIEKNLEIDD